MTVHTEYPRPTLRRESYVNLNGVWDYAITDCEEFPRAFDGGIVVPFSPEAELSGVNRQLKPDQWLHYHRRFHPPEGQGGRVMLHFGAVDYHARVFVNGALAGEHKGGYLPFTFDITALLLEGENSLWLSVADPSDTAQQARGKQKLKSGGMFYTAQSGIWQTVWMERVAENHVSSLNVSADIERGTVLVSVSAQDAEGAEVTVRQGDDVIVRGTCASDGKVPLSIPAHQLRLWSPEDPHLYDLTVKLRDGDLVDSYFALRKFSVERDGKGILRIFLNGKPYLLNGLLDQGYWKEGLYTAPSDEAMVRDIETSKRLGFNLLRKHIKIEPERWYYHCDRLGMVVWQDMVNGGGTYPSWFLTYAINVFHPILRRFPDGNYTFFARTDAEERENYYLELEEMIRHLRSHPSIGAWVPFNEGWGQFDAAKASELVRKLDPDRLIDEASGWFDQGGGDMYSIHSYFYPLRVRPQKDRVFALTEFGGISWPCPGHTTTDKVYGYGTAKNKEELSERYRKLMEEKMLPQLKRGLSALVYTQVSDVEDEVNGIMTYDREVIKIHEEVLVRCSKALAEEFERCVQ